MQTASRMTKIILALVCVVLAISIVSSGLLYLNFSKLQDNFNALQSQYNELSSQYADLQSNNSRLESQFSSLQSQYGSLLSNYSTLQSSYDNLIGAQTAHAGALLVEDAVSWLPNSTIAVYVRNIGTSDATIDAVYIGTSASNLDSQTGLVYNPSNGAVAAQGGRVGITISYSWSAGTTYYIKVVPEVGSALEFNIKA